jgi:hypothetical protein
MKVAEKKGRKISTKVLAHVQIYPKLSEEFRSKDGGDTKIIPALKKIIVDYLQSKNHKLEQIGKQHLQKKFMREKRWKVYYPSFLYIQILIKRENSS